MATWLAVHLAKTETSLKKMFGGAGICKSDLDLSSRETINALVLLGFGGGLLSGCVGLGGGAIYNPMLITLGVPPAVSSATGLYLVLFSKVAACFVYFLNDEIQLTFSLWIGFWSTAGIFISVIYAQDYIKRSGRQSIIVWSLVLCFFIAIIIVPIFGAISLKNQHEEGVDIRAFVHVCG